MQKGEANVENTVHHPAHLFYLLTLILLGFMVLLGFIAVFVPWVMKDIGVGQRAWAYPFKTCIQDPFSKVHYTTCLDNDFIEPTGVPLTGGDMQCKSFILATIAFVFISVIVGVLMLIALTVVILSLWSRPYVLGVVAQIGLVVVCVTAILSWVMFSCYAEKTCAPNSIFPVKGYSYGFILYVFASACSLGSVITGFMGLSKLKRFEPLAEARDDGEELLPAFQTAQQGYAQQSYVQYPAYSPYANDYATTYYNPPSQPQPLPTPLGQDSFNGTVQYW